MKRLFAGAANLLLDPSIVFSFDRNGFVRHRVFFDPQDLKTDMKDRVCLVTGANSGLGYATALGLAERGAKVWLLCRNPQRGEQALAKLKKETGHNDVHLALVDLASQYSVRTFCEQFEEKHIDVLIHNAGILPATLQKTEDGIESTLATHLVGPFLMTHLLLPRLKEGNRARVIWVSSGGMYTQKLNTAELQNPPPPFDGVLAYARAKRGMVVLNRLWAKELAAQGIMSHAMHPGWADTPGVQTSIPGFWKITKKILRNAQEGADTILWLAICDKAQATPGLFWFDRKPRSEYLLPGKAASAQEESSLMVALRRWTNLQEPTEPNPAKE
ncbi:MAG: dehydrogenase [Myxococcales bacterium]|nr:dehydrogenase [Myxococcales bacterium]|tara:strand:- start:1011 stop:2000 length:990 start_codon:yes stop_codon:yes gene_type:complete